MQNTYTPEAPLVLVGCGHMGRAMAQGWLQAGLDPASLYVIDPQALVDAPQGLACVPRANFIADTSLLSEGLTARAVVLAVKPQIMDSVLHTLKPILDHQSMIISIAAGVTLDQLARGVGFEATYVRAMPNTPAAVGAGITGFTAGVKLSTKQTEMVHTLLSATGQVVWIENEDQMNIVTAVSGSGPAYVFHMVEAMAAAGEAEGLEADTAMQLARQTLIGAARLLEHDSSVSIAEMRARVTSPGGTTAAALDVLMHKDGGLEDLMRRAVHAARKRGEDLAG